MLKKAIHKIFYTLIMNVGIVLIGYFCLRLLTREYFLWLANSVIFQGGLGFVAIILIALSGRKAAKEARVLLDEKQRQVESGEVERPWK